MSTNDKDYDQRQLELYKPTMARKMPRKSTLAWLLGYEPSESSPTSY